MVPGTGPTRGFGLNSEFDKKDGVLWFKMGSFDHNKILYASQQRCCHDVSKILLWLAKYVMNKSIANCHWISNLIEILLVGWAPVVTLLYWYHWWVPFYNTGEVFFFDSQLPISVSAVTQGHRPFGRWPWWMNNENRLCLHRKENVQQKGRDKLPF